MIWFGRRRQPKSPVSKPANETRGSRGRRVVSAWPRRRVLMAVGGLAVIGGLAGGAWWSWQRHLPQEAADAALSTAGASLRLSTASLGFVVRDVFVVGREVTPRNALLKAVGVKPGAPILALDLEDARERVMALPWVREASIERVLPDTLVVHIVERKPLALWQHRGKFTLIDEEGQEIVRDDIAAFGHLPVVVGDGAPAHASDLLRMLETEPDLAKRVTAAIWVGNRRWNLRMTGGVDVRLPETDVEIAWRRLATYQRQYALLDKEVQSVDMRLADRLIVKPAPPGEAQKGSGGNDA